MPFRVWLAKAGLSADTLMRMQSARELAQARAHEDAINVKRFAKAA